MAAGVLRGDAWHVEQTRFSEGFGYDNQHGNDHFSSTGHLCNSPLAEM
jgi:hypothetical protein